MRVIWFQISMLTMFIAGAILITNLSERGVLILFVGNLLVCILLGWVVMIQNQSIKFRTGLLWTLIGNLQPIQSKWFKPLEISWPERIIFLSASLLFGACARILWIVNN